MKKSKVINLLVSIIIVVFSIFFVKNIEKTYYNRNVVIVNKDGYEYENESLNYIILYNTVMIPMDEVFGQIFGNEYQKGISQELIYEDMILEINYNEGNIIIPNRHLVNNYTLDDSVTVEIEEEDNVRYIPVYLLSNLPSVIVKIDGKIVYSSDKYISARDIIKTKNEKHEIKIYLSSEYKKNASAEYIGEENGALWREEALKRIEKYRKKSVSFRIINQNDLIMKDSNIKIEMKNNNFNFGTAIGEKKIEKINTNLFNILVSENYYKWRVISQSGYDDADYIYDYINKNNMNLKGHNLWWDCVYSNELQQLITSDKDDDITFEYIYNNFNNKIITKEEADSLIENLITKFEKLVYKHIKEEVSRYPKVSEWDVINEPINYQYFKYYLYDKNLLSDNSFLNETKKIIQDYSDNERYYQFMSKCFDIARENSNDAKLILNDEKINGNFTSPYMNKVINIIKRIQQNTSNINAFGIQYHVGDSYKASIQSRYNEINYICDVTGIKDIIISEYDNYLNNKIGKYTLAEKKVKADYLRDSLIMAYSNLNVSEFTMWVYNSNHFCDEERKAYEETVYPWLNYTEEGTAGKDGYSTRLYKGTYTATITLPNGKKKEVEFEVSDDSSDTIDIIIDSEITDVKLKQKPSKTKYYKNDILDLTDGILEVAYDDGTTKEFLMTEVNATVTGFESNKLGVQTVKLEYDGHTIKFDIYVEEKEEVLIAQNIEKIKQNNIEIKNKYQFIFANESILNKYNLIITNLENLEKDINSNVINNEKINNTYKSEYDFILAIVNEYDNSKLSISQNNLQQIINDIISTSSKYIDLYKYYVNNDSIENDIIVSKINNVINKYNTNLDIDIPIVDDLIKEVKDIYTNNLDSENVYENYLNKQRILNTCEIIETIQDKEILKKVQEESTKVKIAYNYDSNTITNQVVEVQVYLPSDKCIIRDNVENKTYKFDSNGSKKITINIRGYEYSYEIKVTNIDKTSPIINGVVDGKLYTSKITPTITDENIDTIKLILNGEEVKNFKSGTTLTEEGFYTLTVIDKAGNKTQISFQIMENNNQNYIIQDNIIKNISEQTIKSDFDNKLKLGITYKIARNEKEISNTDSIATGDILTTSAGDKYTIIVTGDMNKDGKLNLKDLVKMRKYLLDGNNLDENEMLSADCNFDGKINLKDLVKMRLMLLNQDATK